MTSRHPNSAAQATALEVTTDAPGVTEQLRRPRYLAGKAKHARDARAATGCRSTEALALRMQVSPAVIKQQESRSANKEPRLGQMLAVREYGLHLAGVIAEHHGARIEPGVDVVHGDDHGARLASVTVESTDVLRVLSQALADGALTPAEIAIVRAEVKQAIGALLELDAHCVAAERSAR